jgi:hypothetical protein
MGMPVPPPTPVNADGFTMEDVQRMLDERVRQVESAADAKLKALEARYQSEIAAARGARPVDHLVTANGGGVGTEIHDTWCQWYQDLANKGQITDEIVRASKSLLPIAEDVAEVV